MDFEQKVKALKEMKKEVCEELASELCKILELANKAGISVINAYDAEYHITEFYFDPDMDTIVFTEQT